MNAMQLLTTIRDKVWNTFFLDFYLDPHWTVRFKVMNFISGGVLVDYFTCTHLHLEAGLLNSTDCDYGFRRAAYWTNCAWKSWHK